MQGIGKGLTATGKGFGEAIVGIFEQPVKGASKGGFGGFMKGVGKGLLGIPTKLVSGLAEGVSEVAYGVSSAIPTGDGQEQLQMEPRRQRMFYGKYRRIQPYSLQDARLRTHLETHIDEGAYAQEGFIKCHVHKKNLVILMEESMIMCGPSKEKGRYRKMFRLPWNQLQEVVIEPEDQYGETEKGKVYLVLRSRDDRDIFKMTDDAPFDIPHVMSVVKARYGCKDRYKDVTEKCNDLLRGGGLGLKRRKFDKLFGDVAKGERKYLTIQVKRAYSFKMDDRGTAHRAGEDIKNTFAQFGGR